jgi:hypothetical protein
MRQLKIISHAGKLIGMGVFVLIALGSANSGKPQLSYKEQLNERCSGYGFKPGTTAFSNCLMQIDSQNIAAGANQSRCLFAKSQAYANPGRTGNFGEAQARANAAYNRCMNGN